MSAVEVAERIVETTCVSHALTSSSFAAASRALVLQQMLINTLKNGESIPQEEIHAARDTFPRFVAEIGACIDHLFVKARGRGTSEASKPLERHRTTVARRVHAIELTW